MRTEVFRNGLGSILLVSAIVLSMTLSIIFTATPVLAGGVIEEPGGTTITVYQGEEFTLRFKLYWDEPDCGYFSLGICWDSPRMDSTGTPSKNFTFVSASAYLEDNLDTIPTNVIFSEGVPPENENMWRYVIVVDCTAGYPWNDNFYVDIVMRASGAGGVPHVPTDNHPIVITSTIEVAESTIESYFPPDPNITVRVLGGVAVSISPGYQSGEPGETLSYIVTVKNTGIVEDNYDLTVTDTSGWGPSLSENRFENVAPGENRVTMLSIIIPSDAPTGVDDSITVTAISQLDPTVSDFGSCVAHVLGPGVAVSISPSYQSEEPGKTLSYAVTVNNTGDIKDNYDLTVTDTSGWGPSLSENRFEKMAPGEERVTTLSVTIPSDEPSGVEDSITVTATSQSDPSVSDFSSCVARSWTYIPTPLVPIIPAPGPKGIMFAPGASGDGINVIESGQEFTLRFKLYWDEPAYLGCFWLGIYWDSPRTDSTGTPSENFTFVSASAYLEENLDPIPIGVTFTEGLSPENSAMWRYSIDVDCTAGYPWDGNFYVDLVMRASGAGGVPHAPTYNHPIVISGVEVAESTIISYTLLDPHIIMRIIPPPAPVGGIAFPANKLALLAPWIALGIALVAIAIIVAYIAIRTIKNHSRRLEEAKS